MINLLGLFPAAKFIEMLVGMLALCVFPLAATAQDLEEVDLVVTVAYNQNLGRQVFYIDGVPAPAMTFQKAVTYVFDLSSPTLKQHPFALSDSFNGTHSGGKPYTTSVVSDGQHGTDGAFLAFTPHSDTAAQMFYYCSTHGLMGGVVASTVIGDAAPIFASLFNAIEQSLTVPRVFVDTKPPQVYSLVLELSDGAGVFDIVEATRGAISPFAFPDELQSMFDISTNELTVKQVEVSDSSYDLQMVLDGSQLILKGTTRLQEADENSGADTNNNIAVSPSDSYSVGSYGY